MNMLTDEEILAAMTPEAVEGDWYLPQTFARVIEAAVLAKLTAQDVKPSAYITYKGHLLHADDPKVLEHSSPEPLYTQAQLLAAQQRTAEACARYCAATLSTSKPLPDHPGLAWIVGTIHCTDGIRNGEWRNHL